MQTPNGVDGTLVPDGRADTRENGSIMEDKLTEEGEESEMSSPFVIPGKKITQLTAHSFDGNYVL